MFAVDAKTVMNKHRTLPLTLSKIITIFFLPSTKIFLERDHQRQQYQDTID